MNDEKLYHIIQYYKNTDTIDAFDILNFRNIDIHGFAGEMFGGNIELYKEKKLSLKILEIKIIKTKLILCSKTYWWWFDKKTDLCVRGDSKGPTYEHIFKPLCKDPLWFDSCVETGLFSHISGKTYRCICGTRIYRTTYLSHINTKKHQQFFKNIKPEPKAKPKPRAKAKAKPQYKPKPQKVPDYYSILQISKNASQVDIKKAYLKLAKIYHPDKGGKKENFQEILNAYTILTRNK